MTNEEVLQIIEQAAKDKSIDLDLGGLDLTEIPPEIGKLTNLVQLNLRENKLKVLPPEIGNLIRLKKLYLSENKLTELPSEIGNLVELERIYLSKNKLTELPPEICNLTNLTYIYLRDNDLISLPQDITRLTKLVFLDVRKTQLPVSDDILENTHKPDLIIEKYWQAQQKKESEKGGASLNQVRLVILGAQGVGKTSILERLKADSFSSETPPTSGINLETWALMVNDQEIEVTSWDFGSHEILIGLHQLFIKPGSIYLVVIDATKNAQYNQLEYYLTIINSFSPDAPIIIIANKIDLSFANLDRRSLANKFKNIKGIAETSCLKGEGLDSLNTFLTKEIQGLAHLKTELSFDLLFIKKQLEENQQKYLTKSDLDQWYQQREIVDPKEQENFLKLMQDIGLVLEVNDYIVDAKWLGQNLSNVLTQGLNAGESESFLKEIITFLELGFESPYEGKFVIPHLVRTPEINSKLWANSFKLAYKYNIAPGSLLARLIVRLNIYIHQYTYGAHRAVFATEGSMAMVTSHQESIVLKLTGEEEIRQNFLDYISGELDAIQKTNPGIKGVESEEIAPEPTITQPTSETTAPPVAIAMSEAFIDSTDEKEPDTDNNSDLEAEIPQGIKPPDKSPVRLAVETDRESILSPENQPDKPKGSSPKSLYYVGLGAAMAIVTIVCYILGLGFIPVIVVAMVFGVILLATSLGSRR